MPPEKDETPLLAFIKDEKDEEEHSNDLSILLLMKKTLSSERLKKRKTK